jgi:hypothetical protein
MPTLAFLSVASLILVALLFVADATLEKNGSPVIVTSQSIGLQEPPGIPFSPLCQHPRLI